MSNKTKRAVSLGIKEILFICLTFVMLLPIYYLIITTFKTPADATNNPLSLPEVWHFEGYAKAWNSMNYPHVFKNTFVITVLALGGMLVLAAMASYVLARRKNKFNSIMFFVLLSGMMVPFQMSIITQYKLVRNLGLMNNILSVVLIDIAVNLPMAVLFMKNFISASVPVEIEEAAYIDGCSVFQGNGASAAAGAGHPGGNEFDCHLERLFNPPHVPAKQKQPHHSAGGKQQCGAVLHQLDGYVPHDGAGRAASGDLLSAHAKTHHQGSCSGRR